MWHAIPIYKIITAFFHIDKAPAANDTSDTTEYLIKQTRSRAR